MKCIKSTIIWMKMKCMNNYNLDENEMYEINFKQH